ncbi:hypothetical protein BC829DRAFT_429878 [Chytridium lagenaria]|nr:hypothetical protein BC829DRAFT_429878 [Chytridium lagenaria]
MRLLARKVSPDRSPSGVNVPKNPSTDVLKELEPSPVLTSSKPSTWTSWLHRCLYHIVTVLITPPEVPPPSAFKPNDTRDRFRSGLIDPEIDVSGVNEPGSSEPDLFEDCNPFATNDGLLANTDHKTLKRYLHLHTLRFKSSRLEELYLRTMILPNRIVQIRVFALMALLFFLYYTKDVFRNSQRPLFVVFYCVGFVHSVVALYILVDTVIFDLTFLVDPDVSLGSLGTISLLSICLTSGLSSTFLENLIYLLFILLTAAVKAYLIATRNPYKSAVYIAPFVLCLILVSDLIFVGDRDRRIRFLKTQIIGSRLKEIQEENRKTEYLLSLTLPGTIVRKLKEVGTGNFDLIAERVENASVMFTDLKNYKEIASTLGSTRETLSLLNIIFHQMDSIRLMYNGLERVKTINSGSFERHAGHGLALRSLFENPILYDLEGEGGRLAVKLDVGFGIQIGPLVAGIVGKKTFSYEVYGDVVNTASRMLSIAKGGQIIVTPQIHALCQDSFEMTCLGEHTVKGKGTIKVYSIQSRRDVDTTSIQASITSHDDRRRRRSTLKSVRQDHATLLRTLKPRPRIDKTILTYPALVVFGVDGVSTGESCDVDCADFGGEFGEMEECGECGVGGRRGSGNSDPRMEIESIMASGAAVVEGMGGVERKTGTGVKRPTLNDAPPTVSIPSFALPRGTEFIATNLTQLKEVPQTSSSTKKAKSSPTLPPPSSSIPSIPATVSPRLTPTVPASHDPPSLEESTSMPSNLHLRQNSSTPSDPPRSQYDTDAGSARRWRHEPGWRIDDGWCLDLDEEGALQPDEKEDVVVVPNEAIWSTSALMEAKGFRRAPATSEGVGDDLRIMRNSLNGALKFSSRGLERRFWRDYNRSTWRVYLGRACRGVLCQLILLGMALFNVHFMDFKDILCDAGRGGCPVDEKRPLGIENLPWEGKAQVIWITFTATGLQILFTGLNLLDSNGASPGPDDGVELFIWYRLMTTVVIPQIVVVNALSLDGMEFGWKVGLALSAVTGLCVVNFVVGQAFLLVIDFVSEFLAVMLVSLMWIMVFSIRETNIRIEYLLDLILITQSDMVRDEMTKSSRVLSTILPLRVTMKLLEDPSSMVYEEFRCITVLHMDIAGFTAMSSTMEPLSIFQMLNTLFTHFDRLTEEYNIEKITTIGDAYVASSSLSKKDMDVKIAAISVCIMALQMQAFVVHQLNTSPMMTALNQTLAMRIGVHTGPAYGAIMGGEKNFRYDLLGDTVLFAEKIQELTPLSAVCISEVSWELTKDYHGFEMMEMEHRVAGDSMRVFRIEGSRGLVAHHYPPPTIITSIDRYINR